MNVYPSVLETRTWRNELVRANRSLALVPTMGNLHEGHLSLVRAARSHADEVAVSLFVNPTQFNDKKDLDAYPRTVAADLELLRKEGVACVFTPTPNEMYAPAFETWVVPGALSEPWEGGDRPGHFRGVTTVVTQLFNIFSPQCAVFGEKDFQQLRIIEKLVRDLHMPITIIRGPIVRESSGLAMSSRNSRLAADLRLKAADLYRALLQGPELRNTGETSAKKIIAEIMTRLKNTNEIEIAYLDIVDEETLRPVEKLESATYRLLAAVRVGGVRLLDNLALR